MTITLPFDPRLIWTAIILIACAGIAVLIYGAIAISARSGAPQNAAIAKMRATLGLTDFPDPLFTLFALLWAAIAGCLVFGLFLLIFDVVLHPVIRAANLGTQTATERLNTNLEWGFVLAQITTLTAVLGAVIALPLNLNRLRINRAQLDHDQNVLFNTKFTEAAADLHAQRQAISETKSAFEDDIVRRCAAIDRLYSLVTERPTEARRVADILSLYVRELSRQYPPVPQPEFDNNWLPVPSRIERDMRQKSTAWVEDLVPARRDMEFAVQTLGRLPAVNGVATNDVDRINLSKANLQGFDLPNLTFVNVNLSGAHMQGVKLRNSHLEEANLRSAYLLGAFLSRANLTGANLTFATAEFARLFDTTLTRANLTKANLNECNGWGLQMQLAALDQTHAVFASLSIEDCRGAKLDFAFGKGPRRLRSTRYFGAAFRQTNLSRNGDTPVDVDLVFGDSSVTLPTGTPYPDHWYNPDKPGGFETQWRAWQKSIGFDPDDPTTWEAPENP